MLIELPNDISDPEDFDLWQTLHGQLERVVYVTTFTTTDGESLASHG